MMLLKYCREVDELKDLAKLLLKICKQIDVRKTRTATLLTNTMPAHVHTMQIK